MSEAQLLTTRGEIRIDAPYHLTNLRNARNPEIARRRGASRRSRSDERLAEIEKISYAKPVGPRGAEDLHAAP
jgi:hypothetical protein